MKILMVCLGNICRSPLAEGILKSKLSKNRFYIDSAGTGGYHIGNRPDIRSIEIAKKNGIDISSQKCRQVKTKDFAAFDLIYAMDYSNYNHLIEMAPSIKDQAKVRLLLEETEGPIMEVPDPYYGGKDGFANVFQLIDEACQQIKIKFE
ncbi:low molecular weight protein-tyrosine-phosphatase [Eudoraea chungangensis]|uniref:low molecular weight protein-tyrosine-phosphatase n=1 Tax=Eudoraea chungangensis TaxID=1481905 RepID=UPI0023ECABC1|nr:low molecular weight protein-tyrosine-phosphatase [Eudoraea chungangensis]